MGTCGHHPGEVAGCSADAGSREPPLGSVVSFPTPNRYRLRFRSGRVIVIGMHTTVTLPQGPASPEDGIETDEWPDARASVGHDLKLKVVHDQEIVALYEAGEWVAVECTA